MQFQEYSAHTKSSSHTALATAISAVLLISSVYANAASSENTAGRQGTLLGQVTSVGAGTLQGSPGTTSLQPAQAVAGNSQDHPKVKRKAKMLSTIVVVAPLQASLENAESIKRYSRMIVDSVVAEDIGKLPDNSVAEAMQRIPGVQIAQGFQGDATSVVVRGLPNVETTLNGREIFSGAGRGFAFQNLPATAVKEINVYKTSNAAMLDGGIAGLVNMQLYRPFDFKGKEIAGTLTETNSKYGHHTDPNGSLLLSDRWHTQYGEVGALANFGLSAHHYEYNAVWGDFPRLLTNGTGQPIRTSSGNLIETPNGFGADYNIGFRQRREFNYSLQWAPNGHTQFYVEGIYDSLRDKYDQPFFFSFPVGAVTPSNISVSNNCYPDALQGTYYGQTICDANGGTWTGNTYAATSTQAHQQWGHDLQNAFGVKWFKGRLSLKSNLSFTSSSFHNQNWIVDTFLKGPITTVWTGTGGNHQNWYLAGNPSLNPADFYLNGLFQTYHTERGNEVAWRGDGTYHFAFGPIRELQFGVRAADHKANYVGSIQQSIAPPGGAGQGNIVQNPNPNNEVINVFPGQYFCYMPTTTAIPTSWLTGCYNYLTQNIGAIRKYYGAPINGPGINPGRYFNISEKDYAAYAQAAYTTHILGFRVTGLVGIRAEKIRRGLNAFSFNAATGIYTPITDNTSKPAYLPNFSAIVRLTHDLQARFVAAKTISYPGFGVLNPSISLNPGTINRAGFAASGNPNLSPTRSDNYDASLEWYFSQSGYAAADVFYRNINGYIQNYVTNVTIGGQPYELSSPQSAGHGHLDGAEFMYQQFFTMLPGWLSGLGAQFNYTYIAGNTISPQFLGGPSVISPLQNVSKNNYNVVLMYEHGPISTRLAYDYRSRFIDGFNAPNVASIFDEIVPANQVDFSIAYDLSHHTTAVFAVTNLLGAVLHQYWGAGVTRPRDIRYQDQTYSLGVRFKF